MKKIIILVIALLSLCGCEATYTLTIDETSYNEDIDLLFENNPENAALIGGITSSAVPAFIDSDYTPEETYEYVEGEYYKSSILDSNSKYGINHNFVFYNDNFKKSRAIRSGFKYFTFYPNDNGYRTIMTNEKCSYFDAYPELEKLTIIIKTKYVSSYNNADETTENTYIWHLDRSNYQNHPIKIRLTKEVNETESLISSIPKVLLFIIVVVVVVLGVVGLVLLIRNKKVNKI